jgi:hypothetical protein
VVQLTQYFDLVLQGLGVFDHLLGDEFDDAVGMGWFFESGLVDHSVGASPEDLA